jgi:methylenetetrahydrofolate reductase (NADPH)
VYISGKPTPQRLDEIINIYNSYSKNDWKQFADAINFPQDDEFYLYRKPKTFNTYHSEYSEKYLESSKKARTFKQRLKSPIRYRIGKFIHDSFFSIDAKGYKIGHVFYKYVRGKKRTSQAFHALEQLSKVSLYGCKDCGDCSLPDIAYLCPESQCVKNQRNGPCGGTRAGMCEIPDKECIWSRAYYRLKPFGDETNMLSRPVVFRDSKLNGTSAWSNTFLGLDHNTKKNKIR